MRNLITMNGEFGRVRTMVIENDVWFVGKDIAECLGYKDTNDALKKHVDEDDKMGGSGADPYIIDTLGRKQYPTFINESGLYSLVVKSKTKSQSYKNNFINWLSSEGKLNKNKIIMTSRREIEFIDKLEVVLSPFNINGVRQYNVDNKYRIDFYIPQLDIAVEYDEQQHQYHEKEDIEREDYIKNKLGCKFVRVSIKDSDELNIGLVLKEIMVVRGN